MTLRDVLRKREVKVTEHSASLILERGHIVYARVVEMDGMFFMMGTGTRVIPPSFLDRLLDLRETIESERPTFDGCIAAETLLDLEDELREEYLVIADVLGNQKLHVSNTDGDPLALTTLTYDIPSLGEAFHALKDLEQKATGRNDSDLLAEAERNATGELEKVYIHWLKPRKKSENNDATLLATLVITPSTLVVEVNSEKRSKQIRKEITKRLGEKAVLLRTEITSHEGVLKKAAKSRKGAKPDEESEHDRIMRESPEARALMKQMMEKHWSSWPDIPLPALRGMTPRQASRDPRGRELLESLLMDFESRNRSEKDEFLRVDITRIRRDLGLETS